MGDKEMYINDKINEIIKLLYEIQGYNEAKENEKNTFIIKKKLVSLCKLVLILLKRIL